MVKRSVGGRYGGLALISLQVAFATFVVKDLDTGYTCLGGHCVYLFFFLVCISTYFYLVQTFGILLCMDWIGWM